MKLSPLVTSGRLSGVMNGASQVDIIAETGVHIMLRNFTPTMTQECRRSDGNYACAGDLIVNVSTGAVSRRFPDGTWLKFKPGTLMYAQARRTVMDAHPVFGRTINWRS